MCEPLQQRVISLVRLHIEVTRTYISKCVPITFLWGPQQKKAEALAVAYHQQGPTRLLFTIT